MRRGVVIAAALVVLLGGFAAPGGADAGTDRFDRALPEGLQDLRLDEPVTMSGPELAGVLDEVLAGARGPQRVSIRLAADAVAAVAASGGRRSDQHAQLRLIEAEQRALYAEVTRLDRGARMLGSTQRVLNAVFAEIDASALPQVAALPNVLSVHRVVDYEVDLAETVPYIGAAALHADGFDGSGISVAVLDSGIDYYHEAFGGSGDPDDFADDDPTIIEPGTFPTAKVVGGYDFVGSDWHGDEGTPPEAPDPDPIDDGPEGGHGTHVADIIGGELGVAPGVDLYVVKVCSSQSTACSGIALIRGMEFALDPDGDGSVDDRVDIINMSLGSPYGEAYHDDLSQAVENAFDLGVLSVVSAGNGGDKPYVLGSPSSTPAALSVAQTAVPSAVLPLMEIVSPASAAGTFPAVFQAWSVEPAGVIEGPVQYGDGAGGNLDGCAGFAAGSLAGKIVLVDRGDCNFTLKIKNIGRAGGMMGIIGLIAPGDPFDGGDGGDRPIRIPGYMISRADSDLLKAKLAAGVTLKLDPATGIPLIGHIVGSSSRGPSVGENLGKPDLGAPGASVSAIAGTGTDTGPFGGTSGAAPMVTGAAALLMDQFPRRGALQIKAGLMNNGDPDVMNLPVGLGGGLAPISRIGGGEVRVDAARASRVIAWDVRNPSGGLSFGLIDVWKDVHFARRRVRVRNYNPHGVTLAVTPTFRFADDAASGAVQVYAPTQIYVPPRGNRTFTVLLRIDGSELPENAMNSGADGADGDVLTFNEFDGYIELEGTGESIHLPWHVLPRRDSRVRAWETFEYENPLLAVARLRNNGAGRAQNDAYSLIALSEDIPFQGGPGEGTPAPDIEAVGVTTYPVPAGFCSAAPSFVWAFAVTSYEPQSHLVPVNYYFWLDVDQDGTDDYAVFNSDAGGPGGLSDGRQLTWTWNLDSGAAEAWFFAEHATNTGNTALWLCGEQVGLTGTDMLATNVDMAVEAYDFYYGGPGDYVPGLTVTPLGEQHVGLPPDLDSGERGNLLVVDWGPWPGNTPELGVLMFTNGDRGYGFAGAATLRTESLIFLPG